MKDFLDREIEVGNFIVYDQRQAQRSLLQLAEVLEIRNDGIHVRVIKTEPPNERKYPTSVIRKTNRVTIVNP